MLPVFDEQLAKHLGISELRVGATRTGRSGDERGPVVQGWWSAGVNPSFATSWAVGAIYEEEWSGQGPGLDRVTVRGFMADADGATITPLDADPVFDALAVLNPYRIEPPMRQKLHSLGGGPEVWAESATLDGIGYRLRWGTRATTGGFGFSNPRAKWLLMFERVLFRFAKGVVSASEGLRFQEYLDYWIEHRKSIWHS